MLNNHKFFSVIIIIDNYPKALKNIIDIIIKQSKILGKINLILINNNPHKRIFNLCLDIVNIYQNKELPIEVININKYQTIDDVYKNILNFSQGEILVFTKANCYPDDNWLENLIKPFSDPNVNIVAGEIHKLRENIWQTLCYLINQFIDQNTFQWSKIFNEQIANIALRKEFINQQKSLYLPTIKKEELSFYYRILTEVESEITYNPSAIIYRKG